MDFDLLAAGGARLKAAVTRFLAKRPKELPDVYAERCKRLTYQNILGQALGWYEAALFRRNPEIVLPDGVDDWYNDFLENCDAGGTTFVDTFRSVFANLMLYRSSWILTDLPHAEVEPLTLADEQAAGLDKPYLVNYAPRDVINWATDSAGNLKWAVIRTGTLEGDFLETPRLVVRWYYFDRENYSIYEYRTPEANDNVVSALFGPDNRPIGDMREATQIAGPKPHALAKAGRVPMRRIQVRDNLWLANRLYLLLLEHMDLKNTSSWQMFLTNLPWLVIKGASDIDNVTRSEVGFLSLPDKDCDAFYLQPEHNTFGEASKALDALREEAYRTVYMQAQGRSASATASANSGYSKEMDMMPANDVLNAFGDCIRAGMQLTLGDVAAARGEMDLEFDVRGFTFETKPATETIALNEEFQALGIPSKTAEKEMDKRTIRDVFEDSNEDLLDTMCKEVDAAPTRLEFAQKEQEAQLQSFKQDLQAATAKKRVASELAA
jgi:hypothetical protein